MVGRVEVRSCRFYTKEIFVLNFKPFESNSLWVTTREDSNCRKVFAMQADHWENNIFLAGRGTLSKWSSLVLMHVDANGEMTQMTLNGTTKADIVMRLTGSDALVAGTADEGPTAGLYVQRVKERPGWHSEWQGIAQWALFNQGNLWKVCAMHIDDGGNSILYGLLHSHHEYDSRYLDQILLASFDSSGRSRWSAKERPGVGQVLQCGAMQVFQGKAFIAGEFVRSGSVPPREDIFLMHFGNSTMLWVQREGGDNLQHHFKAMHVDAVGQALVAGTQTRSATLAAPSQAGIFLMKFSNHGDLIWKEYQETQTSQTMTAMWIHNATDIALAGFALQNLSKTAHLRVLQAQGGAACYTDRRLEYDHFLPVLFLFREKSRGWAQWQGKSVGPIRDVRTQEDSNGKFSLVGITPDATVSILSFDAAKAAASITSTSTNTHIATFALMIGLAAGALMLFVIVISVWFRCKPKGGGCMVNVFTRVGQEDEIKGHDTDSEPESRTSDSETGQASSSSDSDNNRGSDIPFWRRAWDAISSSVRKSATGTGSSIPMGLQISRACDEICKQGCEQNNGPQNMLLQDWCAKARSENADPVLKQSVFGLMTATEIATFLMAAENRLWRQIIDKTEDFSYLLDRTPSPELGAHEMVGPAMNERVRNLKPCVMDQTVREPATNTPFGHTGYMKYLTLKIVQRMGFKDIAISGQYYGDSYTPETQILEEMEARKEKMTGMIVMFAPNKEDRKAGVESIKRFNVPNAFLDLTFKASVRFAEANFVQSVLEAVEELDEVFNKMKLPRDPWRPDPEVNTKGGQGEISLNLVDIMEFLDLKPNGEMIAGHKQRMEEAFSTWKRSEVFRRRVVAILFEEGRGLAGYQDYGLVTKFLREHFPEKEKYRILVHAHAGSQNQDVASVEAVQRGANGVWAALIPQAAQLGHNSSMVFLDNMLSLGNRHVMVDFWLHQARECARHCYYLNFNTYRIPDDCPIWGRRGDQLTHTAFRRHEGGDDWRKRRNNYYDVWEHDQRKQLQPRSDIQGEVEVERLNRSEAGPNNFRISPLVSDKETWRQRIAELKVLRPQERVGDWVDDIRALGFALMNANIRANLNEKATLQSLAQIARRNRDESIPCRQINPYLKTNHQGIGE